MKKSLKIIVWAIIIFLVVLVGLAETIVLSTAGNDFGRESSIADVFRDIYLKPNWLIMGGIFMLCVVLSIIAVNVFDYSRKK